MESYKKSILKLEVFYGSAMGLFAGLFGLCFFPGMGCIMIKQNLWLGLILGLFLDIVAAALFGSICGIIYGRIMESNMKKHALDFVPMRDSFYSQNRLLYDGPANHMMGKEGVGGWLFLLNDTLYFKSHQQNIQVHELQIPLSYISKLKLTKSGLRGIFRTGLDVELMDGRVEKYVVNETKIWADSITEACKHLGNYIEIG